jgi:hypothetical protein
MRGLGMNRYRVRSGGELIHRHLAIAFRFAGVSASALALPPFSPPSRPSVTAAAFLVGSGGSFLGHLAYGLLDYFPCDLVEVVRTLAAFA